LLTLLATLLSVPAIVTGATSASADPACTGKIGVAANSRVNSWVGYFFASNSSNLADGAITVGNSRRWGTEANPITRFSTPPDRSATISYWELRYPYQWLRTDTVDRGGVFNINPCHSAVVRVR
jgi:hypothetical protein